MTYRMRSPDDFVPFGLSFAHKRGANDDIAASLPGGHSEWGPPDPIPNSEVKLFSADDSVGLPMRK